MENLIILLITVVLIFCFAFALNNQDIMAPSVMVCMVFVFSIVLALYNAQKWKIDFSFEATALLSLGIALFAITDVIVARVLGRKRVYIQQNFQAIHIDKWKLKLISVLDMGIVILVLREVRRIAATNSWFTNIFYAYRIITSHSDSLSVDQYMNGAVNQSMKIVIVSGFVCAVLFIFNVLICKEKWRKNILLLVPPVMLCLMTLFTGVRTNVLRLCVFSLVCGYVLLQYKQNWRIRTSWKFIRVLAISLVLILVLFGTLQSVLGRSGSTDIVSVIANYAGAPILHFNQYVQDPPAANEVFGQETFTGIWNVLYKLGITSRLFSAHEEYRYITADDFGNVYTLFRRFLQDFGTLGMCIMTIILSAFFSLLYNRGIKYRVLTYKRLRVLIEYGYLYYIIAMASIDSLVHDYLNVGTILLAIGLHLFLYFFLRMHVRIRRAGCVTRVGEIDAVEVK